jgi:thiol-disulfide isomerase/thioredoxin
MKVLLMSVITAALFLFGQMQLLHAQGNQLSAAQIEAVESAVFTDWDGNEVSITDNEGKTVLIDFWETWCSPCIAVMPTLEQLMTDFSDDFVVLAVSPGWSDTEDVVRRFMDENDYSFVFVHGNELASELEIRGIPYKVYVNPDGTFLKAETGSRGPQREYDSISEVIRANR